MRIVLIIFTLYLSLFGEVQIELSHKEVKNGTTFAVVLQSKLPLSHAPNAIFKNKTYQMFTIQGSTKKYRVFLPVDYYSKKQKENLQIRYILNGKLNKRNFSIHIVDGKYKKNEIIKVAKGKVTLSQKSKVRSNKEYTRVYNNVYSQITPYDLTSNSDFTYPMKSKITSAFGNARIYNGITKSYHTGTDFRAKVGTSIYASNNGVVALVMDRFYLGKVVYIDHGRGAYSYYSHMSNFLVKQGQVVKKGEVIGYSGRTGRTTGPHLHYAIRLYNTTVDPIQYGKLYNTIINKYQ